jgi:hypothetical protein
VGVFKLAIIIYIYWLIECIPKLSFVRVFESKNYPCRLVDSMHFESSFVEVFELMKIT